MNKEIIGTFVDAVYAIAITILALEVPGQIESGFIGGLVVYAITFAVLLAFWIQHRRIVGCVTNHRRNEIWLNGGTLLFVCLLPRATTLIFEHGDDVTIAQIEASLFHGAGWTAAEIVDIFYVFVILAADAFLLVLTRVAIRGDRSRLAIQVQQSKILITVLLVLITSLSLLTPVPNRYFMVLVPFVLFFEREILILIGRKDKNDLEL